MLHTGESTLQVTWSCLNLTSYPLPPGMRQRTKGKVKPELHHHHHYYYPSPPHFSSSCQVSQDINQHYILRDFSILIFNSLCLFDGFSLDLVLSRIVLFHSILPILLLWLNPAVRWPQTKVSTRSHQLAEKNVRQVNIEDNGSVWNMDCFLQANQYLQLQTNVVWEGNGVGYRNIA